jgi:plastocyanin
MMRWPATLDITINEKVYRPRVAVLPVGSIVRFPNTDPFDHNVWGDLQLTLNARGYRWQAHKNKHGQAYPTNAGFERY